MVADKPVPRYRAAVIGRTDRGGYGHGLDICWLAVPEVELVAVADDDPRGLERAGKRLGVRGRYRDYREMLLRERPDFVSIGPRWVGCHAEMAVACAEAGVKGIYCEKPFARSPAEADAVLSACARAGSKVAVAHSNRAFEPTGQVVRMVREGAIGKLYAVCGRGKEDTRGGGEDLWVLGVHILDMFRLFAGEPLWVMGQVWAEGQDAGPEDIVEGPEELGPITGDAVSAIYGFPGGIHGHFESRRNLGLGKIRMGLTLMGSEGIITMPLVGQREMWLYPRGEWPPADPSLWQRIPTPGWDPASGMNSVEYANALIAADLVKAVEDNREPIASGRDGRASIEMVLGVYVSHRLKARASLPLAERDHPLIRWQEEVGLR
ncbi:MAG: Gfo/Idh/MocA family oxidoreductase [Armatimonadetes bacterium]|nr:Gfo/Idh/MocA family oxidoreductase [Armatimonadota bacterium]